MIGILLALGAVVFGLLWLPMKLEQIERGLNSSRPRVYRRGR